MLLRFIYVAARDRRDLYESLRAEFAGQSDVAVILDRRRGDRRRSDPGADADLRRTRRLQQPEFDAELRTLGYFLTACDRLVLTEVH